MVGLPGSGKSYWAKKLQAAETQPMEIVSSDSLREELLGDASDQSHKELIFGTLYQRMNNYLAEGKSVIIDATNTTYKARLRIFSNLKKLDVYKVACVVCTPQLKCVRQDAARAVPVGKQVIHRFLSYFQIPQKFEGFDEIHFLGLPDEPAPKEPKLNELLGTMDGWDQMNPHHKYSLGEHCRRCSALFSSGELVRSYPIQAVAGLLHDVGKLYTQTISTQGIAHYYNHASIGAYFLLCHPQYIQAAAQQLSGKPLSHEGVLEVLFLVNYHMLAHQLQQNTKIHQKWMNILGEERFQLLMKLGRCDRLASGTES